MKATNLIDEYMSVMHNIKSLNRDIEEFVFGIDTPNSLRKNSGFEFLENTTKIDCSNCGFLFGIPIRVLDFLPPNYKGVRLK